MQTAFYVSHAGQTYGPWTVEEITRRIAQMELIATDYIYDEGKGAWIALLECEAVLAALRSQKPSAPPSAKPANKAPTPTATPSTGITSPTIEDASSEGAEWFVQKDTHRYGPFTYLGLIRALQEKSIFDYDLVWRKGMGKWARIAEHEAFTQEAVRSLKDRKLPEASKFFFQRKFPRFPVSSEVIVHDNRSVWLGQSYLGSEGGSGVLIKNAMLVPGQVLSLHFTEFEGLPAFNALCEVVNKRYVPNLRDQRAAVPYGVKFVKIDKQAQSAMKEYFASKVAA